MANFVGLGDDTHETIRISKYTPFSILLCGSFGIHVFGGY